MLWSQTLIPTLKESPSDAEIVSHKLLLRAGLVRKLSGGLYTFLPMGLRVLRKIENIIREEMNRINAIEVLMPALQPAEIWHQSGRYETMRDALYKVHDRARKEWVLGPTHEEVITTLVANEINSYRQLPKSFYQIQTKFRDEIRPRFGLMRAKEFIMKDAYSFDVGDEGAFASYDRMYSAYVKIFARCGLKSWPVEADTGAIGGKHSHEFMVPAETGENEVAYCEGCGYAANVEKAFSRTTPTASAEVKEITKFATPGVVTIQKLSEAPYSVAADRQIKTLVYQVDSKPVLILIRGDHQLNEAKFAGASGSTTFRAANADEIFAALGAHPGSLGGVGVKELTIYADETLRGATGMTTGANEDGFHFGEVSIERDIKVAHWADLRLAQAGEACNKCGGVLKVRRAIEVGHVFKLDLKYSVPLNATFLDDKGEKKPMCMGCYGIGVTRTLQAVIEQSNDKDGIIWPISVAPYTVCITALDIAPEGEVMKLAKQLYAQLTEQGVDVILDDRDERPGVKFKDSELVGFPIRVGIGEKSLAKGVVELKRRGGELVAVPVAEALEKVLALVKA